MAQFIYDTVNRTVTNTFTGEVTDLPPNGWVPTSPMLIHDIQPYRSPVTGEVISGRRAKTDDLKRHNCIDAADMPTQGGKLNNKRFAKKHGLSHMLSEEHK